MISLGLVPSGLRSSKQWHFQNPSLSFSRKNDAKLLTPSKHLVNIEHQSEERNRNKLYIYRNPRHKQNLERITGEAFSKEVYASSYGTSDIIKRGKE